MRIDWNEYRGDLYTPETIEHFKYVDAIHEKSKNKECTTWAFAIIPSSCNKCEVKIVWQRCWLYFIGITKELPYYLCKNCAPTKKKAELVAHEWVAFKGNFVMRKIFMFGLYP